MVERESWRDRIEAAPHGVLFVPPVIGLPPPPRRAKVGDQEFVRFMDYILSPVDTDAVDLNMLSTINSLRLRLVASGFAGSTNGIIKRAFSDFVSHGSHQTVVDWGCGFDPVNTRMGDPRRIGVDLDPAVVATQRSAGHECYLPADPALLQYAGGVDAILAAFVFHFRIGTSHIRMMCNLLREDSGVIVANVYRRSEESRSRLAESIRAEGLALRTAIDRSNLCRQHEYWMASKSRSGAELDILLERLADAVDRAVSDQRLT